MKSKPIKIDWEGLEDAFNNQRDELVSYLDKITGHVVLDGEGEVDDVDEEYEGHGAGAQPELLPEDDSVRLYVHPPDTEQKIEWFEQFLKEEQDVVPEVASELRQAMSADDPAEELGAVLNQNPDVRDAWYRFRTVCIRDLIDEWLEQNGIVAASPPPWKA